MSHTATPPVPIHGDAHVVASGLVKRFGGFVAVDHVDLSIGDDRITALIGPNGAGKTTLFNLIAGQLVPDEGHVQIDGLDMTGKPAHIMARHGVGRGFQDVRLFGSMSVLANVMVYAQPHQTQSMVRTALTPWRQRRIARLARQRSLQALDYLGIGGLRDDRCDSLGFAQQKLIAIARLLVLQPRILLLDEPASGLDAAGRATLMSTIRKLGADGHAICFVEHNTHLVRELAQRVIFLAQGKVIADGTPDEVFSHSGLAEAYLGLA
jgi:ABC-type branched-subunit amino acid transport system ATPase component